MVENKRVKKIMDREFDYVIVGAEVRVAFWPINYQKMIIIEFFLLRQEAKTQIYSFTCLRVIPDSA